MFASAIGAMETAQSELRDILADPEVGEKTVNAHNFPIPRKTRTKHLPLRSQFLFSATDYRFVELYISCILRIA